MAFEGLITGITGQDGTHLAQFSLQKNDEVYGLVAYRTSDSLLRLSKFNIEKNVKLINGNMMDDASLIRATEISEAQEVYNLAAQSFLGASWEQHNLIDQIASGVTSILENICSTNLTTKFYQSYSSKIFGLI